MKKVFDFECQYEYDFIDKKRFGEGPWTEEPDICKWIDERTEYDCHIFRTDFGNLCGYVGVKGDHPVFGVGYDNLDDIDVHGGLTYSDFYEEPRDIWFFGFDCAHAGDYIPLNSFFNNLCKNELKIDLGFEEYEGKDSYRDIFYVKEQIDRLILQLKTIEWYSSYESSK